MKDSIEFMYVIFLTAFGKGYGCFAFDKANISSGEVRVAASFCNPNDRSLFNKEDARVLAKNRLSKDEAILFLEYDTEYGYDFDNETIASLYFEKNMPWLIGDVKPISTASTIADIPKWVQKCIVRNAYSFTLKEDCFSLERLADSLEVSSYLFEDMRNAVKYLTAKDLSEITNCYYFEP